MEWCDRSDWNPVRGCTRVSPGCGGPGPHGGCYAEGIAARFSDPGQPFHGFAKRVNGEARWTGKVELIEDRLLDPLSWRKPAKVFALSMSDLFHEALPDEAIDKVFAVMALCPQHTFQVLTKRSTRMREYLTARNGMGNAILCRAINDIPANLGNRHGALEMPLPNVWLGVSTEDQERADERIPDLLATPAAVRFISAEPLLDAIYLWRWLAIDWQCSSCRGFFTGKHRPFCPGCGAEGGWSGSHPFNGRHYPPGPIAPSQRGSGLDWVIVGGESGHHARPMHLDWARSLRDHCAAAGVPFFFKQWGEWRPDEALSSEQMESLEIQNRYQRIGDQDFERVGKNRAGRLLDGVEHNGMPA